MNGIDESDYRMDYVLSTEDYAAHKSQDKTTFLRPR